MKQINIYTNKNINFLSFIITIICFSLIIFIINNFSKINLKSFNINQILPDKIEISSNNDMQQELQNSVGENEDKLEWYIEIKSINLKAPIEETTEADILSQYVGHFEETSLKSGNIGLAAHNRGYEVNYFKDLKSAKIGDEIFYKYYDFEKIYEIDTIEIIEDTDWSYLEKTDDNKITLITCVENEPNYRRCVQATEKE